MNECFVLFISVSFQVLHFQLPLYDFPGSVCTLDSALWSITIWEYYTRKPCYRKDDCTMHPI